MQIDLFEAFTVVAFLMSTASFYFSRQERSTMQVKELENRLTTLELKIDPLWETVRREIPKLLLGNPSFSKDSELMQKAMREESMTDIEVKQLMEHLNDEYLKAIEKKDNGRAVGIALFRATIRRVE